MASWLCLRLPRLPLESLHLPFPADTPMVVYGRRGGRPVLVASASAAARGVAEGQAVAAATALIPELKVCERSPRAEREALQAIAAAAYGFSGQVTTQLTAPAPACAAVWLEIGSSAHLFGGAAALARELAQRLAALGYTSRAGSAATPEAAYLSGLDATGDAAAWRKLPVQALPVAAEIAQALRGSGIRTVGDVLQIPSDALARRFGQAFLDYLGRLTGRLPDARRWYRVPPRFQRRFELHGGAESSEALRFPIKRLLAELAAYLVARDTGVQSCTFEFAHEEQAPTSMEVSFASPTRDPAHLQVVVNARLERLHVPAEVVEITLSAARFAPPRVRQFDLFGERGSDEAEWQSVLDRLCARLGPDAVQTLGLAADHRPEKSWLRVPAVSEASAERLLCEGQMPPPDSQAGRPLWLLPEPRPLPSMPQCLSGPERIDSGWWEGLDARRDYYVAQAAGARLWVFRERASQRWYLHGLWA